jgi:hypothetical protein
LASPLKREGSLLTFVWSRSREGIRGGVVAVAIVWPCPLAVDAYVAAGRTAEFPRPLCPSCRVPMVFWSGYRRHVREAGGCRKIFIPRLRCAAATVLALIITVIAIRVRRENLPDSPQVM